MVGQYCDCCGHARFYHATMTTECDVLGCGCPSFSNPLETLEEIRSILAPLIETALFSEWEQGRIDPWEDANWDWPTTLNAIKYGTDVLSEIGMGDDSPNAWVVAYRTLMAGL